MIATSKSGLAVANSISFTDKPLRQLVVCFQGNGGLLVQGENPIAWGL